MRFVIPPVQADNQERSEMTVACRDCDRIPKVENAGHVILRKGKRVQVMHNGVEVLADGYYGSWMTEIIAGLRGHHEPQEELVFDAILKAVPQAATMIELGGFWSYYSLWFLRGFPRRRAIVVEPDPNHLQIGKTNAEINSANIDFVHGSIGAHSKFHGRFSTESAGEQVMRQVTVSELLEQHQIDHLDVLHCDIQGSETDVIESCNDLFQ